MGSIKRESKPKMMSAKSAPAPAPKESRAVINENKGIYKNYLRAMKKINQQRVQKGLGSFPVRTFEQWSDG